MTIRTVRFVPPSSANFVDKGKIPRSKGGHFPFHKSQLDTQMFGVVGPTRLWTHPFSVVCLVFFKSQE